VAIRADTKTAHLVRILEATVLVIATLYFGRPIFLPVVAAILLTFLLSPPVTWLERRYVPRPVAVISVVILLFTLLGLIAWNATTQLSELVLELPKYQQNLETKIHDLHGSESNALRKFGDSIDQLTTEIKESTDESKAAVDQTKKSTLKQTAPTLVKVVAEPTTPLEAANAAIGSLAGPLASMGVLTVLVIFMLLVRQDLRDRFLRLAGTSQVTLTTRTLDELSTRISRYLLLNALINGGFGLTIGFGLFLIGVQYAALWGLLAAALRFIPYLGVLIAAVVPIGLSIAQFPGWSQPVFVIALFVSVELLVDNIIEPPVYGHSAGVSPVALLLAAMFWGWIWGTAGLVLSVPLTVSLAVLGKYLPPLEPLWILLGNDASLPPAVRYYQRLLADDVEEANEVFDEYRKDHTLVEAFDHVLLPALAQAERDREHGDITEANQELIWNTTEQFLDDLPAESSDTAKAEALNDQLPSLSIVGVPVLDRADELAIKMLCCVAPSYIRIEAMTTAVLTGELLTRLESSEPDLVCISALGPGGVGQVRYICKRVRQGFPHLPIFAGRWAYQGNADKMIANTKERGATYVFTELDAALQALEKIPRRVRPTIAHSPNV
jgi:predicted PurR-regulated permease PerM